MTLERAMGIGHVLVRVFTRIPIEDLRKSLIAHQFGATSFQGSNNDGEISVALILTSSRKADQLTRLIQQSDSEAVVTIGPVRIVLGSLGLSHPLPAAVRK